MGRENRQFVATDLYGVDGRPHASDIHQDDIYNCYFLAPMGTLGERQPDRVSDAIRFNAESGEFTVTLYRPPNAQEIGQGLTSPVQESITVSQEDIRRNISREGGGTVDNNRERNGALWPTVIEAGFAELYGRDPQGRVNLDRGYETIGDRTRGGSLSDGMYALTGDSGRNLQIRNPDAPPLVPTGPDHVARPEPPPFRVPSRGARLGSEEAYTEVEQALAAGRPVSMATQGRDVRDGLMESHAHMVVGVSRDPQSNEPLITLRNPYGTNRAVGEGNQNIGAGWNADNAEITVGLNRLVRDGSFGEFNIGPAPRVQTQQQGTPAPEQSALPTPTPPAPNSDQPAPAPNTHDITQQTHLGYPRFQQALNAIEHSINIPSGTFTDERLQQSAANLAYASLAGEERTDLNSRNESLSRIDFAVFNKDRDALIAGKGELGNPSAELAWLSGAQDNNTSLTAASQRTHDLLQDPQKLALASPALQQGIVQNNPEQEPAGPRR